MSWVWVLKKNKFSRISYIISSGFLEGNWLDFQIRKSLAQEGQRVPDGKDNRPGEDLSGLQGLRP